MLEAVVAFLVVPPINLLLLCALGWVMSGRVRFRRLGRAAMAVGGLGLVVLAMPGVGAGLLVSLEGAAPPLAGPPPEAIVVLGGDVSFDGSVPPDPGLGPLSLERVRAAASLARRLAAAGTKLPLLVTGGVLDAGRPPVAAMMAASLATDFATPVRWQEGASRTTWENAERSAPILKAAGIGSVYLVTHGWHMRRALIAFRHFGIVATPAPVRRDLRPHFDEAGDFVPRASGWLASYWAFHEWIGCAAYALRG